VNSCVLKHLFLERVEQPKISPKKPGNAFSDALLMSCFQNFAADAAKKMHLHKMETFSYQFRDILISTCSVRGQLVCVSSSEILFLQKEGSFAKEERFYNRDLALERALCVKYYFCKRRALLQKKGSFAKGGLSCRRRALLQKRGSFSLALERASIVLFKKTIFVLLGGSRFLWSGYD